MDLEANGTQRAAAQLIAKLSAFSGESVVSTGRRALGRDFERVNLLLNPRASRLKEKGVYLITGGLGGIGLVIADHLARNSRKACSAWAHIAATRQGMERCPAKQRHPDRIKQILRKLIEIQSLGAEVLTVGADVTRLDEMKQAIHLARRNSAPSTGSFTLRA